MAEGKSKKKKSENHNVRFTTASISDTNQKWNCNLSLSILNKVWNSWYRSIDTIQLNHNNYILRSLSVCFPLPIWFRRRTFICIHTHVCIRRTDGKSNEQHKLVGHGQSDVYFRQNTHDFVRTVIWNGPFSVITSLPRQQRNTHSSTHRHASDRNNMFSGWTMNWWHILMYTLLLRIIIIQNTHHNIVYASRSCITFVHSSVSLWTNYVSNSKQKTEYEDGRLRCDCIVIVTRSEMVFGNGTTTWKSFQRYYRSRCPPSTSITFHCMFAIVVCHWDVSIHVIRSTKKNNIESMMTMSVASFCGFQ